MFFERFDPALRTAYICTDDAMSEHKDGVLVLSGTHVKPSIAEAFATLDE